jgi:hypothetical protein
MVCQKQDCQREAEYRTNDNFNVGGMRGISFAYLCAEHLEGHLGVKVAPGHSPREV